MEGIIMGWGCSGVPMKKGCEGISMISTNAAMMPLPRDEATPPVTNIYLVFIML